MPTAAVEWRPIPDASADSTVLRGAADPFNSTGGLRVLHGDLGHAVIKLSAVHPERHIVEAPAIVFHSQEQMQDAFKAGELDRDFIAVVRFQGPKANGMPELHKLMPPLGVLQDRGFRVALVTDGRLSGASGKVPAAIHVTPEAMNGGGIGKVIDGDIVRIDGDAGTLSVLVSPEEWAARPQAEADLSANAFGCGRELFAMFRANVSGADTGAAVVLTVSYFSRKRENESAPSPESTPPNPFLSAHNCPTGTRGGREETHAGQDPGERAALPLRHGLCAGRRARQPAARTHRHPREAGGLFRRQVAHHRFRAVERAQFRHPPHRRRDAIQGALADPPPAARLELLPPRAQ